MEQSHAIQVIVGGLREESEAQGLFLAGSLATSDADEYSDLDVGVVSGDAETSFKTVFALWPYLATLLGDPLVRLQRSWGHCRMVALLYGTADYPPYGLEVDLIVSRLKHVGEQMPHSQYRVLFDRAGRLEPALARSQAPPAMSDVAAEVRSQTRWFPFYIYDANKSLARGDSIHVQSLLQQMREAVFSACAARKRVAVYGSKRVGAVLSREEREIVEASYRSDTSQALAMLRDLYPRCLHQIPSEAGLEHALRELEAALGALPLA